ncbi:hypothetical protein BJX99DRAFT_221715 [Aspergillus californicus]
MRIFLQTKARSEVYFVRPLVFAYNFGGILFCRLYRLIRDVFTRLGLNSRSDEERHGSLMP